jgi:CRP-like cAMP-binding protein
LTRPGGVVPPGLGAEGAGMSGTGGEARLAKVLEGQPFFGRLEPATLAEVVRTMRMRAFDSGASLFQRGDGGDRLYVVASGLVRLSMGTADGRIITVRLAGPGEMIGEIAALDGGARTADATAVVAGEAASLSRADLGRLISAHPGLRDAVLSTLCERLRATTLQLESVALMPLETRAARLLLAFARRSGTASRDGRVSFPCDVSQSELAALVGASRPKLNRVLMQFEADGLLARNGRVYAVDARGLAALAAEEWA